MPDHFLTREQVAEELGVSPWVIYARIRRGELPAIRIGGPGLWRISREDLAAYIERALENETPAQQGY